MILSPYKVTNFSGCLSPFLKGESFGFAKLGDVLGAPSEAEARLSPLAFFAKRKKSSNNFHRRLHRVAKRIEM
jgi:hypothetical protein